MYIAIGLAIAAVAAVLFYDRHQGEVTEGWVGKARQLAAVVLVLTQAVEGLIGALDRASMPGRPSPAGLGARFGDVYDEEPWR